MTEENKEGCDCIERLDASMKADGRNTAIMTNILSQPAKAIVATYAPAKIRGKKAAILFATYCPFCGLKYGPWESDKNDRGKLANDEGG